MTRKYRHTFGMHTIEKYFVICCWLNLEVGVGKQHWAADRGSSLLLGSHTLVSHTRSCWKNLREQSGLTRLQITFPCSLPAGVTGRGYCDRSSVGHVLGGLPVQPGYYTWHALGVKEKQRGVGGRVWLRKFLKVTAVAEARDNSSLWPIDSKPEPWRKQPFGFRSLHG